MSQVQHARRMKRYQNTSTQRSGVLWNPLIALRACHSLFVVVFGGLAGSAMPEQSQRQDRATSRGYGTNRPRLLALFPHCPIRHDRSPSVTARRQCFSHLYSAMSVSTDLKCLMVE